MRKTGAPLILAGLIFFAALWTAHSHHKKNNIYFMAGCTILDEDFDAVRKLSSAYLCLPTADGGWFSADNENLIRHGAGGEIIWKRPGFFSHQVRLLDPKTLLVLFSEIRTVEKDKVRFDVIQKLNADTGEVLKEFSVYKDLFLKGVARYQALDETKEPVAVSQGARLEGCHLNSISFTRDNIFVNDKRRAVIVLDHDLQFQKLNNLLERTMNFNADRGGEKHDIQFFEDGTELAFVNHFTDQQNHLKTFKIYEFKHDSTVFSFPNDPADYVESSCCGGVEEIGDKYLVGIRKKGAMSSLVGFISNDGHWLVKKELPYQIQEIKKIPYPNYMELNED